MHFAEILLRFPTKAMKPIPAITKMRALTMALAFMRGDEATRTSLRKSGDFFPSSNAEEDHSYPSMIVRLDGQFFLIGQNSEHPIIKLEPEHWPNKEETETCLAGGDRNA